jgi:hypothetical protein
MDGFIISTWKEYNHRIKKEIEWLNAAMQHHYRIQTAISENEDYPPEARTAASMAALEIRIASVKLFREGVATVLKEMSPQLKQEIFPPKFIAEASTSQE